jgi:4-oxalocrotonate tautomerase
MAGNRDDRSACSRNPAGRFEVRLERLPKPRKESEVPYINVKLIEGVFTPAQKREIVERMTDTMVEIEGENMRQVTTVVIDETKSGDWAIGGRCLSTEDVRALAAASAGEVAS